MIQYDNILGITLQQLTFELQNGIRLPQPETCPFSMAYLIQNCFHENTSERPSFSEIKETLEKEYDKLRYGPTDSATPVSRTNGELQYADLELANQYLDMKVKNQQQKENQTNHLNTNKIVLDGVSLSASYRNETPRYLSLGNVTSSANPLPTVTVEYHRSTLNKQRISSEDDALLQTPTQLLSPGSNGLKRFFSLCGEDPTLPLGPEQPITHQMTPAKSYPNPAYDMILSNFNSNGAIDDKILSMVKTVAKTWDSN